MTQKRCPLPTYWVRWRRRRYQSLTAQGLAKDLAWRVAAAEAKHRNKIAKIIGRDAARNAALQISGDAFLLIGTTNGLTHDQVREIDSLNSRAMSEAA